MRICIKCNKSKEESGFYTNGNICKICKNTYNKEWSQKNPDRARAYKEKSEASIDRKKYWKEWYKENRSRKKKYNEKYALTKKERINAVNLLNNAINAGKIEKAKYCTFCNRDKNIQGHHKDYSRPFCVLWLCASCHQKLHGYLDK